MIGSIWVRLAAIILVHAYVDGPTEMNRFLIFSATAQAILTAIVLFIYVYQLVPLYQVDITSPILKTQEKIARLKVSTLWAARILFLQLPAWTTFWWNEAMFREWNIVQWSIAGSISLASVFAAIWLYFNIKIENCDKKWFRIIFNGKRVDTIDKISGDIRAVSCAQGQAWTRNKHQHLIKIVSVLSVIRYVVA